MTTEAEAIRMGETLREARRARGLTQPELAQLLGRGRSAHQYISAAERGRYLSVSLAEALNKFFGLELSVYGSKEQMAGGCEPLDKPYTAVCTAPGCANLRDDKALRGLCVLCYVAGTIPAGLLEKIDPPVPKPPRSPTDRELRNRVIGVRIRDARLARGWNQAQLGAAIGASSRRISDMERGRLVGQWVRAAGELLGVEEVFT